jgi:hypothetical protein
MLDALAQALVREHAGENLHRLEHQQHARARVGYLDLLRREQQEHEVDHDVRAFQRLDGGPVAGERGLAEILQHRAERRPAGHVDLEGLRAELLRRGEERLGVRCPLVVLREYGESFSGADLAQLQLGLEQRHKPGVSAHIACSLTKAFGLLDRIGSDHTL